MNIQHKSVNKNKSYSLTYFNDQTIICCIIALIIAVLVVYFRRNKNVLNYFLCF